jgi:hypothetical protein
MGKNLPVACTYLRWLIEQNHHVCDNCRAMRCGSKPTRPGSLDPWMDERLTRALLLSMPAARGKPCHVRPRLESSEEHTDPLFFFFWFASPPERILSRFYMGM